MARLSRFGEHRFVGTRDDMRFYDCDDDEEYSVIADRVADGDLLARKLLQAFAPDTAAEARNRGFRPL